MAFLLSQSDTVTLDVTVTLDSGTDKFKAEFKRPKQEDVERFFNEGESLSNKELLANYWVSFSGLKNKDGEVEYSQEMREIVLSVPEANTALATTFTKFVMDNLGKNNRLDLRSKN